MILLAAITYVSYPLRGTELTAHGCRTCSSSSSQAASTRAWLYTYRTPATGGRTAGITGGAVCSCGAGLRLRTALIPRAESEPLNRLYAGAKGILRAIWKWRSPSSANTGRGTANDTRAGVGIKYLVGATLRGSKVWPGTYAQRTRVAGSRAVCPGTRTLTCRPSREVLVAELVTSAVSALLCQSHPRDGGQHTTNEGAAHPPKRLAARARRTGSPC